MFPNLGLARKSHIKLRRREYGPYNSLLFMMNLSQLMKCMGYNRRQIIRQKGRIPEKARLRIGTTLFAFLYELDDRE